MISWTAFAGKRPLMLCGRPTCQVTTLKAAGPTAIQELVPIAATFVAARFWQPELLASSPRLVLLLTGLSLGRRLSHIVSRAVESVVPATQ